MLSKKSQAMAVLQYCQVSARALVHPNMRNVDFGLPGVVELHVRHYTHDFPDSVLPQFGCT
jgi:hypothetical protein